MGWLGGGLRVWFPVKVRFFSLHIIQTSSGANQVSYPMCKRGSFPGGKAARDVNVNTPASAEVNKTWIYTSTPPYISIA
jgi:hypothetical protein